MSIFVELKERQSRYSPLGGLPAGTPPTYAYTDVKTLSGAKRKLKAIQEHYTDNLHRVYVLVAGFDVQEITLWREQQ